MAVWTIGQNGSYRATHPGAVVLPKGDIRPHFQQRHDILLHPTAKEVEHWCAPAMPSDFQIHIVVFMV